MLDNNIILIPRWYEIKTDLLSKNSIERVDVIENKVDVQGFNLSKFLLIDGRSDDRFVFKSGYSELVDKKFITGRNSETQASDYGYIESNPQEIVGTLRMVFDNKNHDTNAENYSVSNIDLIQKWTGDGINTFKHFYGLQGSVINAANNGKRWDENFVEPIFTFEGNQVTVTFPDILLYGDYTVFWISSETTQNVYFTPFTHSFNLKYGGFEVNEEQTTYGTENSSKSIEVSRNGFYEASAKVGTERLSVANATHILSRWRKNRQCVEATILCEDFFNDVGDKLVNVQNGELIKRFDKVAFSYRNGWKFANKDGSTKVFNVRIANFIPCGVPKLKLFLIEE